MYKTQANADTLLKVKLTSSNLPFWPEKEDLLESRQVPHFL